MFYSAVYVYSLAFAVAVICTIISVSSKFSYGVNMWAGITGAH